MAVDDIGEEKKKESSKPLGTSSSEASPDAERDAEKGVDEQGKIGQTRNAEISQEQFKDRKAVLDATGTDSRSRDSVRKMDGANPFKIDFGKEEQRTEGRESPANPGKKEGPAAPVESSTKGTEGSTAATRDAAKSPEEGESLVVDFDQLYEPSKTKSEAAQARETLKKEGLEPSKPRTSIDIYEPFYPSLSDHKEKVRETIKNENHGLSPDANVREFSPEEASRSMKLSDYQSSPQQLKDFAAAHSTQTVKDLSGFIEKTYLTQKDPAGDGKAPDSNEPQERVLNVSQEHSQLTTAGFIAGQLRKAPESNRRIIEDVLGKEKGEQWIEQAKTSMLEKVPSEQINSFKGSAELEVEMEKALVPHVKEAVSSSQEFQKAMDEYRQITRRAAENGTTIVVAAGNQGDQYDGSVYNYYAQSDHVISVGGHDGNKTPADPSDDTVWNRSSPGNEKYKPTVTAEACNIPSDVAAQRAKSGTSYAAPLVSATLASMADHKPGMSIQEKKDILQQCATPFQGVPPEKQGAGRLDPAKAIREAKERNKETLEPIKLL